MTRTDTHHRIDADCTVGDDGCCVICGVAFGDPCYECGGSGFHNPGCKMSDAGQITWYQPPVLAGQMIHVSYGQDDDGDCWERTIDQSIERGTATYRYLCHACELNDWEPWNDIPSVAR